MFDPVPSGFPRAPVGKKRVYPDARNMMFPSQVTYDRRGQIWKQFEPDFGQFKNDVPTPASRSRWNCAIMKS